MDNKLSENGNYRKPDAAGKQETHSLESSLTQSRTAGGPNDSDNNICSVGGEDDMGRAKTPANHNNTMLNFNDDYASILNNLTNGTGRMINSEKFTGNGKQNGYGNQQGPVERVNGVDKDTLDLLLQHYQELLNKSQTNNSGSPQLGNSDTISSTLVKHSHSPNMTDKSYVTDKPCDHCRRRKIKCVLIPDLTNCIQCEAKGIKCTFSEFPGNNAERKMIQDQMSKRERVDENVNVHELLKRTKLNNAGFVNGDTRSTTRTAPNTATSNSNNDTNINTSNNNNDNNNNDNNNTTNININRVGPANIPTADSTPSNQYYTDVLQSWYKSQTSPDSPNISAVQKSNNPKPVDYNGFPNSNGLSNRSPPMITSYNNGRPQNFPQPPIQYPRSSYYVGPTSVFDINLINHMKLDKIDQIQLSKTLALRKVSPTAQFILRDDFNQQMYLKQERDIDLVERLVHPHGKILVDIFFKLIHPYFPILHERVFLEKYSRSYRELTAPILASIYSLGLQWWDFHPQLIGFPKPDVVDQLNEIALKTFYEVFERPKLSIVQTGLLILHCRSECPNNWVLCSEVVALAEDLGLGIDCQDWRLPRWERGLRRRLAWAVWSQDKWTSLLESRHSHLILGRNWMVKLLSEEDFPDSSPVINSSERNNMSVPRPMSPIGGSSLLDISPTNEDFNNGKLLFRQMVSLSIILGEIMDTFYTLGAMKTTTKIEQVLKLAKPLQLKLREWYHSLPHQLSMNNYSPGSYNSNATLTLAYFAAEITLHRKIISSLTSETPPELVSVCRTAAKTRLIAAIEFVRDLKTEHINSFWYNASTGNLALIGTFSALLYVTSPTKDESIIFRDCLRNYIWILRMTSKSFDKAGNALNRIHMLLTQIPGLLTDEVVTQPFVPPRSQSPFNPGFFPPSNQSTSQQQSQSESRSQYHFQPSRAQSPYYSSTPHGQNTNNMSNSTFQKLKNLSPEILQGLSSLQSNLPSVPSTQFSEFNEVLKSKPKDMNVQVNINNVGKTSIVDNGRKVQSPRKVNNSTISTANSSEKPITPSSVGGNMNLNASPPKETKELSVKDNEVQYDVSPSSIINNKASGESLHNDLKKSNDDAEIKSDSKF